GQRGHRHDEDGDEELREDDRLVVAVPERGPRAAAALGLVLAALVLAAAPAEHGCLGPGWLAGFRHGAGRAGAGARGGALDGGAAFADGRGRFGNQDCHGLIISYRSAQRAARASMEDPPPPAAAAAGASGVTYRSRPYSNAPTLVSG